MYLYKFKLNIFKKVSITKTVIEVVEKPKTYITVGNFFESRILKSAIGIATDFDKRTVYLLEDDIKKASEIFVQSLKEKIEAANTKIKWANEEITDYEKSIEALSKELEGE